MAYFLFHLSRDTEESYRENKIFEPVEVFISSSLIGQRLTAGRVLHLHQCMARERVEGLFIIVVEGLVDELLRYVQHEPSD